MDLNEFKSKLKSGSVAGCYVFAGEEDYLKKHYLSELSKTVLTDDALSAFNHLVYDGAEVDFAALTDAVKAPPMMSDYKLIEWKYPSLDKMKAEDLDAFEKLLDLMDEYEYTVLVFIVADGELDLGTPKRKGKFESRFGKRVGLLNFEKSTDTQLLPWLKKHFDAEGISVSAETLRALIFRSGHSMTVLNNEVEKLSAYAKARNRSIITEEDVTQVASSTAECDTFALSNAILDRNKKMAFVALDEMKRRRLDPLIIIAMMARTFSDLTAVSMMLSEGMGAKDIESALRMGTFKAKIYLNAAKRYPDGRAARVLEELSRVDTASKFGGVTGYTAIELFISKCL